MLDTLIQFFAQWGFLGLFLGSFLAGSIVPFSSEALVVACVGALHMDPVTSLFVALAGNASPLSPTSPAMHHPFSIGVSTLELRTAAMTRPGCPAMKRTAQAITASRRICWPQASRTPRRSSWYIRQK